MSAAEHPTWVWFKRQMDEPSKLAAIVRLSLRSAIILGVWYFTRSRFWCLVAMFSTAIVPDILVALIDTYLRIQFSLLAMLLAIVTLQLPMILFFTAESGIGTGLGVALLLIWILLFGSYIKIRLAIANESSIDGRWRKIKPDEVKTE